MEDSIERLKRTLYSRNENLVPKEKRAEVEPVAVNNVPTDWGTKPDFNLRPETPVSNNFFRKFLFGSVGFFVLAIAAAAFIVFGGWNMISSNNVSIKVTGPTSVSSGDELDLNLSVVNQNRADLQNVSLYIDYPEGSQGIIASTSGATLSHEKIDIGNVKSGESRDHAIRLFIFGGKDAVRNFNFRLEYAVAGSNAVFSKTSSYQVVITSSPLLLKISAPLEVDSGSSINLSIDLTSNSAVLLKNTLLKINYPYGFTYASSNMKPVYGNSVWNLGDLKGGDNKNLTISGTIVGVNLEDRTFTVSAGTANPGVEDFDTALAIEQATVGIRKSSFNLSVTPSSNGGVAAGNSVPMKISWENTMPDKTINNHIEVTLSGNFDRASVIAGSGFYRSIDNTIIWNKNSTAGLAEINPGDTGMADFSFTIPKQLQVNPHVDVHAVMTGDRSGAETGTVTSSEDISVKISSSLSLTSQSFRNAGPFVNTGSVPPRVDRQTAYTITWTMTNTVNDISSAVVTATLSAGVTWLNQTSPSSERISYDSSSQTVTWNAGTVSAGAGFVYSPKSASFQVGLTPSLTQVGATPTLVSDAKINGTDAYANTPIQISAPAVTTRFSDQSFVSGEDRVVK